MAGTKPKIDAKTKQADKLVEKKISIVETRQKIYDACFLYYCRLPEPRKLRRVHDWAIEQSWFKGYPNFTLLRKWASGKNWEAAAQNFDPMIGERVFTGLDEPAVKIVDQHFRRLMMCGEECITVIREMLMVRSTKNKNIDLDTTLSVLERVYTMASMLHPIMRHDKDDTELEKTTPQAVQINNNLFGASEMAGLMNLARENGAKGETLELSSLTEDAIVPATLDLDDQEQEGEDNFIL